MCRANVDIYCIRLQHTHTHIYMMHPITFVSLLAKVHYNYYTEKCMFYVLTQYTYTTIHNEIYLFVSGDIRKCLNMLHYCTHL